MVDFLKVSILARQVGANADQKRSKTSKFDQIRSKTLKKRSEIPCLSYQNRCQSALALAPGPIGLRKRAQNRAASEIACTIVKCPSAKTRSGAPGTARDPESVSFRNAPSSYSRRGRLAGRAVGRRGRRCRVGERPGGDRRTWSRGRNLAVPGAAKGDYNFVDTPRGSPIIAPCFLSPGMAGSGDMRRWGNCLAADAAGPAFGGLTKPYSPWHEGGDARCSCGTPDFAATLPS